MAIKLPFLDKLISNKAVLKRILEFIRALPGYLPGGSWHRAGKLVAIELSSLEIKLLMLSKHEQKYRIDYYATAPLPPETVVENEIRKPEYVTKTLERLIDRTRLKAHYAITSLPSSVVIRKTIMVNETSNESLLDQEIDVAAARHIPHKLENVSLDYVSLGRNESALGKMNILLVAAPSQDVATSVEVIEDAGIMVKILDVDSYTICRSIKSLVPSQIKPEVFSNGMIGILNIGATMTSITVMQKDNLLYSQEELFGGEQLTEAIQRKYNLSREQAELAKITNQLPDNYRAELFEPFRDALTQQIVRMIQFFFSSGSYDHLDMIVLCGGVALTEGLVEKVSEQTEIKTIVANPCANLLFADTINRDILQEISPSLMLILGLGIRGANL